MTEDVAPPPAPPAHIIARLEETAQAAAHLTARAAVIETDKAEANAKSVTHRAALEAAAEAARKEIAEGVAAFEKRTAEIAEQVAKAKAAAPVRHTLGARRHIAVYDKTTGRIKQIVKCFESTADKQHHAFDNHHFRDITGHPDPVHPNTHVIDHATGAISQRDQTVEEARALALRRIHHEFERVIHTAIFNPGDFAGARAAAESKFHKLNAAVAAARGVDEINAIGWGAP